MIPVKCRNGWTKYKTKCLKVFNEAVYYSKAKQVCTENNATMISIESSKENEFIANLVKKSLNEAWGIWIGAKKTGSGLLDFEWENGDPFLYSNWDKNNDQPNNVGGNENYVIMFVRDGYWHDYPDTTYSYFICELVLIIFD